MRTSFHNDPNNPTPFQEYDFSGSWAHQASRLAFEEIEDPHSDLVATFLNLALYSYSQGQWRKSCIYKG